jgi:hypothetical protein
MKYHRIKDIHPLWNETTWKKKKETKTLRHPTFRNVCAMLKPSKKNVLLQLVSLKSP